MWLIKWATIQEFYTVFSNAIYVSEYIISFIYFTKRKRVCLRVCERKEVIE